MPNSNITEHRSILQRIARRAMLDRGLYPDFSSQAFDESAGTRELALQHSVTLPGFIDFEND